MKWFYRTKTIASTALPYYEVANTFYIQVRRKRFAFEEIAACLGTLDEMPVDIDEPNSSAILQLPAIAHRFNITSY